MCQQFKKCLPVCPKKSTRQVARESEWSRYAIRVVLHKELNFHPWKPHYVLELKIEDCNRRMEFSELMLAWHEVWPQLSENILWSDEAVFHVGGYVHRQLPLFGVYGIMILM